MFIWFVLSNRHVSLHKKTLFSSIPLAKLTIIVNKKLLKDIYLNMAVSDDLCTQNLLLLIIINNNFTDQAFLPRVIKFHLLSFSGS